ncbi:hypothetical protein TYRP_009662 [Tyrophagus putrescentiae]|nr:hypothetical protein TYRP_009662 [Tyrophagus putrescentiae]
MTQQTLTLPTFAPLMLQFLQLNSKFLNILFLAIVIDSLRFRGEEREIDLGTTSAATIIA